MRHQFNIHVSSSAYSVIKKCQCGTMSENIYKTGRAIYLYDGGRHHKPNECTRKGMDVEINIANSMSLEQFEKQKATTVGTDAGRLEETMVIMKTLISCSPDVRMSGVRMAINFFEAHNAMIEQ